jgi:uncharacterized FAD-dependent dehydrogenase
MQGLRLPLEHSDADLIEAICRRLRLEPAQIVQHRLVRRSVDARRHDQIRLVYSLDLELTLTPQQQRRLQQRKGAAALLRPSPDSRYQLPLTVGSGQQSLRPLVIGAGPCGYFAALVLAQMGLRPVLLERGPAIRQRTADTFGFWRGERPLDLESNVQFGEGGAGTFSDGKLYSQVSEPLAYQRKVLEELVAAGANPEILTRHHPHIGTFKLATVVRGLRQRIEGLGGTVRFQSRVESLQLDPLDRRVRGVVLASGESIAAQQVLLAPGHSARDLFETLQHQGVALEAKAFAMGVRIEHPQGLIDRARWGPAAGHPRLGPAEYKLVHHCSGAGLEDRSVWSFCMCPGGLVVGAASEAGMVVTNGMSQHSRNERNANSGLVVNITLADVDPYGAFAGDPLAGVVFQRHWERRAFALGGGSYAAPSQSVGSFLADDGDQASCSPRVPASYQPGVVDCSLDGCLPSFVAAALRQALPVFARSIQGYADAGARLTGVETRTSSPLRIVRDPQTLQSLNTPGLFPAGEGAGYAGGILSAAIDGIKVAEAMARTRVKQGPDAAQVQALS